MVFGVGCLERPRGFLWTREGTRDSQSFSVTGMSLPTTIVSEG